MTSAGQYIVRLISSEDHQVSKDELLRTIRETGTDRYDPARKQIANEFYAPQNVDFFGTVVEASELDQTIKQLTDEFGGKTLGDRGRSVTPDIALIYKASECDMIQHVYEDRLTSDCFKFLRSPLDALEEVRVL